jgi:uncharacterized protein with FMN-binding domain
MKMKKGIIVILAVAIIGAIAVSAKSKSSDNPAPSNSASAGTSQNTVNADSTSQTNETSYKDGTYTGDSEGTSYGAVQVSVVISGGKITDVNFLQMPQDRGRSTEITNFSEPLLKNETIKGQSANIDFVTGATVTSSGYQMSLQAALDKAVVS